MSSRNLLSHLLLHTVRCTLKSIQSLLNQHYSPLQRHVSSVSLPPWGGCSVTQLCLTLWNPMDCSTSGFPVLHHLPESAQTHVHWVSDAIQPSHPLSPLLLLLSIFPSIRVFSNESALHIRGPKYWSFSCSTSSSNEYSRLITFRIDWFDLAVQGILKSLLQHHILKASILQCSAFFILQLSHPFMTTGKTIALTRWIFVGNVMSLLFNKLSMSVITFLPRSKVSFNFMAAITICSDFGVQKNKVWHGFPIYFPWSDGTRCHATH